ncbi:outer membrane beta-barrel family protein [Bacteroides sp.]|uniref:outer membrane beta-barrel family protein n=1 Tax=Bacteroides sp. TaxID=29523 RepID=UPI0026079A1A|nr:outer membrane beta-barrel family protein [Bacteroides sp.]MDD3039920.1 outer membrane beta-barrel family protein [Bacteroides sp.]
MKILTLLLLVGMTGTTSLGYAQGKSQNIFVKDSLNKDSIYQLQEVVIQTSLVKRKVDRFVQSVPTGLNKDGVELLQQAPGVWLSDERISINGSSGTKVYVDNREIRLTGELLIEYLHSLKSDDIARVEVIPMSGADKDANAQGGAIHIIMRRRMEKGLQGNLSMNTSFASSLQSYQPSGSLNFHSGKWDLYGFASGTLIPQNKGDLYTTREYINGEKDFSSRTLMKQPSRYGTVRTGAVYTMDDSNSVGVEFEYVRRGFISPSQSYSSLFVGPTEMESQGIYRQKEMYNMYSGTANYVHKLDQEGSVLKLVADYISKDSRGNNQYRVIQQIGALDKDTVYRSHSDVTYQIATADFSWKQQLNKKSFLQLGMKYTYIGMKDDALYEGREPDESWKPNVEYGYELDYGENIGALYGTYSLDMKRGAIHLGLRGEYTQTSNDTEQQTRKYWDWFPHMDGSFYFDEVRKWMLIGQYGRYIERPAFTALNPNRIQTSDYSYLIGNPTLRPTYINKFSMTLVYNFRYTLTVGGNLHRDLIREFGKEDAVNSDISYVINENHNRENHWFVAVSAPWQPVTWLNLNANLIGVRQDIRMYKESDYMSHYLYFANANATFNLPKDYSVEGQFNGASRLFSGNSGIEPHHTFNLHLRKKWNDGRCVATLGIDNIFDRRNSYFSNVPSYDSMSHFALASKGRLLKLTFTWNFKQGSKSRAVTVEKQSSSERNRLEGSK